MTDERRTGDQPLPATTTGEENLHSASQRRVNIIWEVTQAFVATSLTVAYLYCAVSKIESATLNNAFFLVVGFYFGRTNHTRSGGVDGQYAGSR